MHKKHGFTLVEVLFVVMIAAGIMAFALPAYKRVQERAKYNAALGTLLDINNAVNSLKQDLKVSTNVSVDIPGSTASYIKNGTDDWNGTAPAPTSDVAKGEISWNQYVVSQTGDNLTKAFMWALHKFKYLKPIQNTDYDFYILKEGGSSDLTKCHVGSIKGTACMYRADKEDSIEAKDCYGGALVKEDGSIVRIKGNKCTNE